MNKYDIYIDEDKVNWELGFLVVKNTPYLQQILYNKRQKFNIHFEVHFSSLNNMAINLYKSWINLFLNFEDIYELENEFCFFEKRKWNKNIDDKKQVIISFVNHIKDKFKTNDIVIFLDFDTEHKKNNIENSILKGLEVNRVYHLNSKSTDMLQLVDILLWSSVRYENGKLNINNYKKIHKKILDKKNCPKWELKSYLWNYLFECDKKWKLKK